MVPPEGKPFGKCVLTDRLGEGGMGEVWKAWDPSLSRWIAIKILENLGAQDVSRFHREAQAAGHLNHPNVAVVHEVGEAEGRPYIAPQYVDGVTLAGILETDPRVLVRYLRAAALAIHAAHEIGIIHRDLKPENIMVEKGLEGLSHAVRLSPRDPVLIVNRTRARATVGEHAKGVEDLTSAIDIEPRAPELYVNRAVCHHELRNFAAAEKDLEKAIAVNDRLWNAWAERGNVRSAQGRMKEAAKDYTRAIQLQPDPVQLYLCRERGGDKAGAAEDARKGLSLDPTPEQRQQLQAVLERGK